jgi:hypothetical protein
MAVGQQDKRCETASSRLYEIHGCYRAKDAIGKRLTGLFPACRDDSNVATGEIITIPTRCVHLDHKPQSVRAKDVPKETGHALQSPAF